MFNALRVTEHRDNDDLLTAGLGRDGLRAMIAPAFADPERPTAAELRRRALWSNWRGIADLTPGGGYGDVYGSTANVPGREFNALATLPGAAQPHRVMVQVPDAFDIARRWPNVVRTMAHASPAEAVTLIAKTVARARLNAIHDGNAAIRAIEPLIR